MKLKWCLFTAAVLTLLLPRDAGATGACISARFHDWNNQGCNQNYAGAGGPASSQSGAGGNQSSCNGDCGMPRWWVNEPYISLSMSDKPLSYTTSSGQEMAFRFYYKTRTQLPSSDEIVNSNEGNLYDQYAYPGSRTGYNCGNNAFWGNNWTMSIQLSDANWDSKWFCGGYYPRYIQNPNFAPYSQGYQALLWRDEGGMNYFNIPNGSQSSTDPQSQVKIVPLSGLGFPVVETFTNFYMNSYCGTINLNSQTINSVINVPIPDAGGIYWGDAGIGVKLVYPNGSQDVFGLSAAPIGANMGFLSAYGAANGAQETHISSASRLLLTQRIDPQGRTTYIGYEHVATNGYNPFFRVRYVVDTDGRTNAFSYVSTNANAGGFLVNEIDDPYGRKTTLGYSGFFLTSITDAANLISAFFYNQSDNSGWITNMITPYGKTTFNYYDLPDTDPANTTPNCFIQRAIYIQEPTGAQQLYCYIHNTPNVLSTDNSPSAPGQSFDNGIPNNNLTPHYPLTYRNTYHWGPRQFANLSSTVQVDLNYGSGLAQAITDLSAADFNRARTRHWLMNSSDQISITESLSSEVDPTPDINGGYQGLRTWYNYSGKTSPELTGTTPQPSCVARLLPDGTSQYTTYNYYPTTGSPPTAGAGLVSDNETTYTKPDGTIGLLTNWFVYGANSVDLVSISNSAGQFVSYGYNGQHQITKITNALNQVTTLTWNPNLSAIQWPSGGSVSLNYNSGLDYGRLQSASWSPSGRTFTVNSYAAGLPASITDDRGLTVTNTWDGLNRLINTKFPDNASISNRFYRLDLVATKDRMTNWTYYGYDGLQHLTSVTNANTSVTTLGWCGCGSLTSIIDALNNITYLNYDNQGNLTNVIFPDSSSLTYQFDIAGRMTNAFDGLNRAVHLAYNNQSLPVTITGTGGVLRQTTFDALNRPASVTDANGVTVNNQFDAINHLVSRSWSDGIGEGFGYSPAGLIAYTNRDQKVTRYGRDGAGRLTTVTNANIEVTQFGYDSLNNVLSLTDGLQHQTSWKYNQYGWVTNKVDGLTRNAFVYSYNANGWVTNRWTLEKGNTIYTYDKIGNLKSIVYPQQTTTFAYDALNRLTNMVDTIGQTAFSYTSASRLQSETGPWASDTVAYAYTQGLRTGLTLSQPAGTWSQTYGFDALWRMSSITSPAGIFGYSYNYQPDSSLVTGISLPNGATINNEYDALGRLTQTALINKWGHTLDGYTYTPDALGLRTNIVRNLGLSSSTVSAGFDSIGQLTGWNATEPGGTLRQNEQLGFGYDAAHNLHTRNNGALAQTFTPDAANQLNSVSRSGNYTVNGATPAPATSVTVNGQPAQMYGDFTFASTNNTLSSGANTFTIVAQNVYGVKSTNTLTVNLPSSVTLTSDNNGNLTNDGARTFGYDSENQLTNITLPGQWRSDFVYDGLNRRRIARDFAWQTGAWVMTNEVRYIYDGLLLIQERDASNNPLVTYTRGLDLGGSLRRAGGIGGLLARTDSHGSTFYHADGIGNITALMDGNENIVVRYLYNPFGKLTGQWGALASANTMQFSSMPQRRGIALFPFRGYEPNFQRFLNSDPIGEAGGLNIFRMVGNNPINRVDPLGLQAEELDPVPEGPLVRPNILQFPRGTMPPDELEREERDLLNGEMAATGIGGTPRPETEAEIEVSIKRIAGEYAERYGEQDPNTAETRRPYSNPKCRPKYASNQILNTWNNAKQQNSKVYDPNTGEELFWDQTKPRNGQWDMGHYGRTYQDLYKDYMAGNISTMEFLAEYRDPNNYRPMSINANRSRNYD